LGDSLAWASHGCVSRAEVLAGASPVGRPSASMAGSVSDEASTRCERRCWLGQRGTGAGWHHGGPWQQVHSFSCTPQCHCFDDVMGLARARGRGGTRGVAARALKARRHPVRNDAVR
jgi:hypothetical protein